MEQVLFSVDFQCIIMYILCIVALCRVSETSHVYATNFRFTPMVYNTKRKKLIDGQPHSYNGNLIFERTGNWAVDMETRTELKVFVCVQLYEAQ